MPATIRKVSEQVVCTKEDPHYPATIGETGLVISIASAGLLITTTAKPRQWVPASFYVRMEDTNVMYHRLASQFSSMVANCVLLMTDVSRADRETSGERDGISFHWQHGQTGNVPCRACGVSGRSVSANALQSDLDGTGFTTEPHCEFPFRGL